MEEEQFDKNAQKALKQIFLLFSFSIFFLILEWANLYVSFIVYGLRNKHRELSFKSL